MHMLWVDVHREIVVRARKGVLRHPDSCTVSGCRYGAIVIVCGSDGGAGAVRGPRQIRRR